MTTDQNQSFGQNLTDWKRTTQKLFCKTFVEISAVKKQ